MSIPPGPTTRSPFGHLFSFAPNPLLFLQRLSGQYGDIVSFRIRKRPVFFLNRPDLIKDVLVTHQRNFVKNPGFQNIRRILGDGLLSSEGDFHLRQRRLIQPAFRRERVNEYAAIVTGFAARAGDRWRDGAEIDMSAEMTRLTLAVVGRAFFNADVEDETSEISQALTDAMSLFEGMSSPSTLIMDKIPLLNRRFRRGRDRLDEAIYRIIEARRVDASGQNDVLGALLLAEDDDGGGGAMTDKQIRDEALTLFLAGHETSAVALAWTLYLLARHPEVEAELEAELRQVLNGRLPAVQDVPDLQYTRMVLAESMRLYPPVYMIGRQALEDFPVDEFVIPAGSSLIMSQYIMHRDPRFFPHPDRFDPQRWTAEEVAARPKFSYFPFGGGVRLCIGEPFAWLEMILVIASLAQRWKFQVNPIQQVELEPRVTLRPKGGMPLVVRERIGGVRDRQDSS
jgi:cytochrome P450